MQLFANKYINDHVHTVCTMNFALPMIMSFPALPLSTPFAVAYGVLCSIQTCYIYNIYVVRLEAWF